MDISIIGSGHVGLVSGACFADLGNRVLCMDHDHAKIRALKMGKIPFYEPGLSEMVRKNVQQGRLHFSTQVGEAVQFGKVIFVCVGTPPQASGEADISAIEKVGKAIAKNLKEYRLIVEKSTIPVQTGSWLLQILKEAAKNKIPVDVAANSEFLREGSAVEDFFKPDRIILGVQTKRAEKILLDLYRPFSARIIVTDLESAELIKHASNSFLAMKISFINLVSRICERVGANIEHVASGLGSDKRIGRAFLDAGIGYGGSCFPKDLRAFIKICEKLKVDPNLLESVERINDIQQQDFLAKVKSALGNLKGRALGVLGLAFKPNTDDMRNAPSRELIRELEREGANIVAYDPQAMPMARKMLKRVRYRRNAYDVCRNSDALLIFTEWREFKEMDLKRMKRLLKHPIVIDGRNIYDPEIMKKLGFRYYSVGKRGAA